MARKHAVGAQHCSAVFMYSKKPWFLVTVLSLCCHIKVALAQSFRLQVPHETCIPLLRRRVLPALPFRRQCTKYRPYRVPAQ